MRTSTQTRMAAFGRDRRGNVTIIAAFSITVVLAAAAFAVDAGSLYLARRSAQGAVDLAAIAAARDPANAEAIAREVLADNGISNIRALDVTPGRYTADPSKDAGARFEAGATPADAVRVALTTSSPLYFGRVFARHTSDEPQSQTASTGTSGSDTVEIGVTATARTLNVAAMSIGSRLARLDGGLLNALLSKLLGSQVSLTLLDYRGLADAQVDLFGVWEALATRLDLQAATFDELLSTTVDLGILLEATADAAARDTNVAASLRTLAASADGREVVLSDLFDAGPFGSGHTAPMNAPVPVFALVSAAAGSASKNHQIEIGLAAAVAGLADATLQVAIGERPQGTSWLGLSQTGAAVTTAQTRAYLELRVGGSGLLSAVSVRLPLYLELASARAQLASLSCEGGRDAMTAEVAVSPAIAEAWIGDIEPGRLSDAGGPPVGQAHVVDAPLLHVRVSAHTRAGNTSEQTLTFRAASGDIGSREPMTVSTYDAVATLTGSLLRDAGIDVSLLGLNLLGNSLALQAAVADVLSGLTPAADAVLDTLLETLGLSLGEADVWVHGGRCGAGALVG